MTGFAGDRGGSGGGVAAGGDVLDVGVLEVGRVFETVAKEAVYGDVGDPDEGKCCGELPVQDVVGEEEREREGERMDEVVGGCSCARVDEVAEHEEIGSEEEEGEEKPAVVKMLIGEEGEDEEGGFFGAEEEGGAGEHE
jgi:hypothetical protein